MSSPSLFSLLVVDDEPDLRTLYELTLLREGYDVETAATVEEAWMHLKDRTYSAVITDMRLPDGTGLDLLHRIEDAGRREKAIVITAYGSAENAVEALKAGAFDYLTKPVDLRQFRSVVASALGRTGTGSPTVQPGNLPSGQGTARPAPVAAPSNAAPAASTTTASHPGTPAQADRPQATASPPAEPSPPRPTSPTLRRMAGNSIAIQQVRSLIEKVARSMAPVWVHGESGTGKELVARAIHEVSVRATGPFVAVNCGAIPEQLLEAEFFGYRKGAFTGAQEDREGFFQAARGGTLFLDEIGDLPLSMQSKLLRSIQERAVRPVGAIAEIPVDVRIVSATHKDLAVEVPAGRFRQDLYYRLNVIQIRVPPLRERIEDLPAICLQLLERIAQESHLTPTPSLSREAMAHLMHLEFPGNVRELENLLHRAVALSAGGDICSEDLGLTDAAAGSPVPLAGTFTEAPAHAAMTEWAEPARSPATRHGAPAPASAAAPLPSDLAAYLDEVERDILVRTLEQHRYNRTAAGSSLGLSLRQMRYRMARLGVVISEHGVTIDLAQAQRGEDEADA